MAYFAMIKLGTDILLVLSMVFLCYRLLASGSISGKTSQLMILEASLKGLIKDAEGAGRSLNDELQRRQYTLEKLLQDFEGSEKRIAQIQDLATKQAQDLEQKAKAAHALITKIAQNATATSIASKQTEQKVDVEEDAPEPPSFQATAVRPSQERHKLPERRTQQNTRLTERIERTVAPTSEAIERTAEEVRKLAETTQPSVETINEEKIDSRLGVLGAMKRQVQTL